MKLSIITINLNNKVGLQKTIDSIVSQTFTDYEWIVIDGGSTDGSKELIEQYADHIAYWVSEPDKGIYNAMNKGIREAKGEYCFFLNSGDYLIDRSILQQAFDFQFDEDIVWGYPNFKRGDYYERGTRQREITLRVFLTGSIYHSGNVFIRKKLFEDNQYGMYDESLKIVSDWKWFLQAMGLGVATGRYIDLMISVLDCTGISMTQIEKVNIERDKVLQELVPERILRDYEYYKQMISRIYSSASYRLGHFLLSPFIWLKKILGKKK